MERGLQSCIAKCARVDPAFLSRILNGKKKAGLTSAKNLARATGTDPLLWMERDPEAIEVALKRVIFMRGQLPCQINGVATDQSEAF